MFFKMYDFSFFLFPMVRLLVTLCIHLAMHVGLIYLVKLNLLHYITKYELNKISKNPKKSYKHTILINFSLNRINIFLCCMLYSLNRCIAYCATYFDIWISALV